MICVRTLYQVLMENRFVTQMENISINNKYLRWWKKIITAGLLRADSRKTARAILGYAEGHHILPRSFGGPDDLENIVYLTAREHIIVHHLTYKFSQGWHKKSAWVAFCMMVNVDPSRDQQRHVNSRYLALSKERRSPDWATVENLTGEPDDVLAARYGTTISNICNWRRTLGVSVTPRAGTSRKDDITNKSSLRSRRWRDKNSERHKQYMRDYRRSSIQSMMEDPDEIWFERDARKRKALIQATPPWADREAIRKIYEECEVLNQRYPATGFTVHHIVPITHPKVCGLHVAENLKVVSKSMKRKLGRKFRPS